MMVRAAASRREVVDRVLVERAMEGDHDAFADLVRSVIGRLHPTARLITGNRETAQDAVQEALIRAWQDLPSLRDPERLDAWLYRILVRTCYDEIRRRQRRRNVEGSASTPAPVGPDGDIESTGERDRLDRAFARIGPEHRAVIVLHLYVGHSIAEVAEVLSIPEGTVKSRLHRGLRELRAALAANERTPSSVTEAGS
jgi:RNA polymerase sigma-70 factor (ECF subfamily)